VENKIIQIMDNNCAIGWQVRLKAIFLIWGSMAFPILAVNKQSSIMWDICCFAWALCGIVYAIKMLIDDFKANSLHSYEEQ